MMTRALTLGQLSENVKGELFGWFVGASKTAKEQIGYKHQPQYILLLLGKCHISDRSSHYSYIYVYITKISVTLINSHETSQ